MRMSSGPSDREAEAAPRVVELSEDMPIEQHPIDTARAQRVERRCNSLKRA